MLIAIIFGAAFIVAGLIALAVYAAACEAPGSEWRSADRAWYRSGGDVASALSLDLRRRSDRSARLARSRPQNTPPARPRS